MAGNSSRHDLDDTQELNYPPVLRPIAETGCDASVSHAFIPKGDPVAALEPLFTGAMSVPDLMQSRSF